MVYGGITLLHIKKRVERDGRIMIGEVLKVAKIKPGDLVEIVPTTNKITIKAIEPKKPKGVVRAVAGEWKNRPELVEELLRIREDEDDRPGTSLD
ncbi:hypothetical protein SY88_06065 [Clostridiales bacterium PH28_bin88]|nr:hypothetical protein SY88_06065 [Clostridiales bacterium PH28_bin88]